jgi:hypothetical protein
VLVAKSYWPSFVGPPMVHVGARMRWGKVTEFEVWLRKRHTYHDKLHLDGYQKAFQAAKFVASENGTVVYWIETY